MKINVADVRRVPEGLEVWFDSQVAKNEGFFCDLTPIGIRAWRILTLLRPPSTAAIYNHRADSGHCLLVESGEPMPLLETVQGAQAAMDQHANTKIFAIFDEAYLVIMGSRHTIELREAQQLAANGQKVIARMDFDLNLPVHFGDDDRINKAFENTPIKFTTGQAGMVALITMTRSSVNSDPLATLEASKPKILKLLASF